MTKLADVILSVVPPIVKEAIPKKFVHFEQGVTPLSSLAPVLVVLVVYLATIFGIQYLMKDSKPLKLNGLFQIHNLFLTTGSGLLLVLIGEEVIPIWLNGGFNNAICAASSWTPRLETYYIINYYFKYVELVDTVFLAAKKKPLHFLHVFHHSATAALCYFQLVGKTSVSWFPIVLNLTVHVLMYYYYMRAAAGAKIWWKKYLTSMQICQFIADLFVVYYVAYEELYRPGGSCAGNLTSIVSGCALLSSYLVLFIQFYIRTYSGASKKAAAQRTKTQ